MRVSSCSRWIRALLIGCAVLLPCAVFAASTPTLPHNLDYFGTAGPSGYINPGVLVGFNPQPDPPGDNAMPDLTNPYEPVFTQPGVGEFTILFGIHDSAGSPVSFDLPTGGPIYNSDKGEYEYNFLAAVGSQGFSVVLDLGGFDGSWQGFNPQPDPPGFGGQFVGFSFQSTPADPMMTMQLFALDPNGNSAGPYAFTPAPEPMSLVLLGSGLAGILLRKRQVNGRLSARQNKTTPETRGGLL
jgi:PEP-CTERM motif